MTIQANEVEKHFLSCGFLGSPLERRHIVSLLIRGFSDDEIYRIGCDVYCEAN